MDEGSTTRLHGAGVVVRLHLSGEFDIAQVSDLTRQVDAALARTTDDGCLVVDLTEVEFMDCAALSVLIRAAKAAVRRRIEIQLTGARGSVARLLPLTQARRTLTAIWLQASNN